MSDPQGRTDITAYLPKEGPRVFPVGRLDYQSEGLLLLTNDGDFAHRITAPSNHVTKTYVVKVNGPLTEDQEKIFAPFTQLPNQDLASLPGSGLGLTICRELVQLMGGKIGVESEPGKKDHRKVRAFIQAVRAMEEAS